MNINNNLKIIVDTSIETFLSECGPLLYQEEPTNSLMLGLLEGLKAQQGNLQPLLMRILEGDRVVSAATFFRREPLNVILTYANEGQLRFLAQHLLNSQEIFSGVVGPREQSENFVRIWSELTGKKFELAMGQKIYKLQKVIPPNPVPGQMKVASQKDLSLVQAWIQAFVTESLPGDRRTEQQWREHSENVLRRQGAHLWVRDGQPVAMAIVSRPTLNGVSVSGVYTPPAHRKKGYASAVVASLSQKMLDQGKAFCVLYTDLANPTSNKIYQEIGYREVCESKHFNLI